MKGLSIEKEGSQKGVSEAVRSLRVTESCRIREGELVDVSGVEWM